VFSEVFIVCEHFRRTWTPGFVESNQCAVFSGPSLFGYTSIMVLMCVTKVDICGYETLLSIFTSCNTP
jgi:hypothetical protein